MTSSQNQASLFGLDLRPVGDLLRAALVDMVRWPLVRGLFPQAPVAVRQADGRWAHAKHPRRASHIRAEWNDNNVAAAARGHSLAIVPTEDVLLRWSVDLPSSLSETQRFQSLALEVASRSPFTAVDSVWASHHDPKVAGREHIILASRRILTERLLAEHADLLAQFPATKGKLAGVAAISSEVWVPVSAGSGYVVLPGFGESARADRNHAGAWAAWAMLVLALMVLVAIAMTPTVRLYLELQAARGALLAVERQAADAVELRQAMVRETDRVKQLQRLMEQPVSPVDALLQITRAIPDGAFLRGLEISGSKVTLTGEAPVAASLMTELSHSPGISAVRAPRPATKPAGAPRESFVIELQLTPSPAAVPDAKTPLDSSAAAAPQVQQP